LPTLIWKNFISTICATETPQGYFHKANSNFFAIFVNANDLQLKKGEAMNSVQAKSLTRSQAMRRRLVLQITTVVVHIFIIKFTVPNIWWALFGLAFWTAVIFWAARSGRWVCANFCWLGGVQDWLQPLAKKTCVVQPQMVAIPCVAHTRELDTNPVAFYGQDVQRRRTACASATARR
jgi:hypothetical protein